ncbi:MAG: WD40 repeat domain-containing protein [Anaerolineae bacterium]|nr:WD40 repeat domain-containing protein [Anaerolineae bacterium]
MQNKKFQGHQNGIIAIAVTPDESKVISSSWDGSIRIWNLPDGQMIQMMERTDDLYALAATPDNHHFLTGSSNGQIILRQLADCSVVQTYAGHSGCIKSLAVIADGKYLVSGADDNTIKVWDFPNNTLLHTFECTGRVEGLVLSPDEKWVIGGIVQAREIQLWDVTQGTLHQTLKLPTAKSRAAKAMVFSPDGRFLYHGTSRGEIMEWDLAEGTLRRTLPIHETNRVTGIMYTAWMALSPDGRTGVSLDNDFILKTWDRVSGTVLRSQKVGSSLAILMPNGREMILAAQASNDDMVAQTLEIRQLVSGKEVKKPGKGLFSIFKK